MPAYFNEGFSVREPMWHGLGTVLDEYPGREEAMRLAGHDFRIIERPIEVVGNHVSIPGDGWKALVKSGSTTILNVVRESYGVVQNDVLWDIVDTIVDQPNVKYETAGVLRDGAVLWVLAYLDEPRTVLGDDSPIVPYVCVSTTHDGSGACKAQATSVRVVCWNTYSAAGSETRRTGREFTFKHTKNVMARIEDAKLALRGVRAEHDDFMRLSEELAKVRVTPEQRELFVTSLIPMPPDALISERVRNNVEEARAKVRRVFETATIPDAHQYTGYGLFQAGIEYLDHLRGYRSSDTYFGRAMLRPEAAKGKLAGLVREIAVA